MTQEEKELLIKDLCGRQLYGLIIKCNDGFRQSKEKLVNIDVGNELINYDWRLTDVKPYLRPMTSMTEEEEKVFGSFIFTEHHGWDGKTDYHEYVCIDNINKFYDWLNKNMFDYRGLIEKGLALEATEWMCEHETKLEFNESGQRIGIGCKIRSKTNPDVILSIVSDDCHEDKFECSNGSVLSLKQIKKHYDLYIEENKGTIVIN
jgi:hypothetical protein